MIWAALILAVQGDAVALPKIVLPAPGVSIQSSAAPLSMPKHSPSQKDAYTYRTTGFVDLDGPQPRFRVFSQTESTHRNLSGPVVRMLLRLWQLNFALTGMDHAQRYNRQLVDVYLCETGAPGGEQLFGLDPDIRKDVNAIFIYDLKSFTEPLEMAREVAHEYGHATMPPVGGYKDGESWINGDMGEQILLRTVRDEMAAGNLSSDDAMGAKFAELNAWVEKEVNPLVLRAAGRGPTQELVLRNNTGRNAFLGFAAYCQAILPGRIWRRALTMFGSTHAEDLPPAVVESVAESEADVLLTLPPKLRHIPIWIPVKGKILQKPKPLAVLHGWAKINPAGAQAIRLISTAKPEPVIKIKDSGGDGNR